MNEPQLPPTARRALDVFRRQTNAQFVPARRAALWRSSIASAELRNKQQLLRGLIFCAGTLLGAAVLTAVLHGRDIETQPVVRSPVQK